MRQARANVTGHAPDSGAAGPVACRTVESEVPIGAPEAAHAEDRALVPLREGGVREVPSTACTIVGSVPFKV